MGRSELIQKAWEELENSTPRRLRLRPIQDCARLWGRAAVIAALLISVVVFFSEQGVIPAFARYFGSPAKARITRLYTRINQTRMGADKHYFVGLDYENKGTDESIDVIEDTGWFYQHNHVGDEIQIHFLGLFPSLISFDLMPAVPDGLFLSWPLS